MEELNVFDKLTAIATPTQLTLFGDSDRSRAIAEHKAWLQSIRHERPNTESNYKIGIYIRYFMLLYPFDTETSPEYKVIVGFEESSVMLFVAEMLPALSTDLN